MSLCSKGRTGEETSTEQRRRTPGEGGTGGFLVMQFLLEIIQTGRRADRVEGTTSGNQVSDGLVNEMEPAESRSRLTGRKDDEWAGRAGRHVWQSERADWMSTGLVGLVCNLGKAGGRQGRQKKKVKISGQLVVCNWRQNSCETSV